MTRINSYNRFGQSGVLASEEQNRRKINIFQDFTTSLPCHTGFQFDCINYSGSYIGQWVKAKQFVLENSY
tara:strand:+ start:247 stop:456 length:210 start_codon:yes stop_codon:yes gene_type:complete